MCPRKLGGFEKRKLARGVILTVLRTRSASALVLPRSTLYSPYMAIFQFIWPDLVRTVATLLSTIDDFKFIRRGLTYGVCIAVIVVIKTNVFGFIPITMCFWVGTQFVRLEAREAGATRANKAALLSADHGEVVRTVIYFGRPLRVRRAPYVDDGDGAPVEDTGNGRDGNRESGLLAQGRRVAYNNIKLQ
jgi:hypothetical protein